MKHLRPTVPNVPFCKRGWRIPAVLLTLAYIATLAWGIHLWREGVGASSESVAQILGETEAVKTVREAEPPQVAARAAEALGEALPVAGTIVANGSVGMEASAVVEISGKNKAGTPAQPGNEFIPAGSGVIVTPDGNVLTAWHLIKDLRQIRIHLHTPDGGRNYPAELVKKLPNLDLAMVKIQSRDPFPHVILRTFPASQPGERVRALSHFPGTGLIATTGSMIGGGVSVLLNGQTLPNLLRTDAVFLGEHSGGAVLDATGRMLGLALALQDGQGGILGHVIPADLILHEFADVATFPKASIAVSAPDGIGLVPPALNSAPAMGGQPASSAPAAGQRPVADEWWRQARALVEGNTVEGALPGETSQSGTPVWTQAALTRPVDASSSSSDVFDDGHILGYSPESVAGLLLLGLISGISGGMMTMGGGIIKVSGLMLFFGYGMVLVRPVAYLTNIFLYGAATLRYRSQMLVRWEEVRPLIPWAMAGILLGFVVGNFMGGSVLRLLLGLFALLVGVKMLAEIIEQQRYGQVWEDQEAERPEQEDVTELFLRYLGVRDLPERHRHHALHPMVQNGLLGLPLGIISGILGITGGVVEVPLQRYVAGIPLRNAIANSAVLVFFASLVGSAAALVYGITSGAFDWKTPLTLSLFVIPGAYVGGWIGAWLTQVVSALVLRWIYAILMFIIAARMFWE
ncbi:MAG: TSUP family transporter [Magnetococcales bacterium]|nr:TSUP family transporter [Magnetococcales bacterium]